MIKRIKQYFIFRKVYKRLILLERMIDALDKGFDKGYIPNWKRKQFWKDFIQSPENRKKLIEDIKKGIYGAQDKK